MLSRILYVDDEPDIQFIARTVLEKSGLTVQCCHSGKEALEKIGTFKPDLILLDVMMPELDGPATLKCLRAMPEFAKTPVIFMTAKAQTHEIARFKKMGVLDVITKPFDALELPALIKTLWEKR